MTAPAYDGEVVSQALYTWSPGNIDGSSGIGFAVVSPSLRASVDWLQRLQPSAFDLYHPDDRSRLLELSEHRMGFSQIGRTVKDGVGIVYRKTADGVVDAKRRPQVLVHALMGPCETLSIARMVGLVGFPWRERIRDGEMPRDLPDLTASSLPHPSSTSLDRAVVEARARELLQAAASSPSGPRLALPIPPDELNVQAALVAFRPMADLLTWDPFVGPGEPIFVLGCDVEGGVEGLADPVPGHGMDKMVLAAAHAHLKPGASDVAAYARAAAARPTPGLPKAAPKSSSAAPAPAPASVPAPPSRLSVQEMLAQQVSDEGNVLTEAESVAFAKEAARRRMGDALIRSLTQDQERRLLANVESASALREWSKTLYRVPVGDLLERWNATRLVAYLGISFVRGIGAPDLRGKHLASPDKDSGVALGNAITMLPTLARGADTLRVCFEHGLCRDGPTRATVASCLRGAPGFLFDRVLKDAEVDELVTVDFIRLLFVEWANHRRLPAGEARAIESLWSRGLLARLKALLT